jgi:hypothetical protein
MVTPHACALLVLGQFGPGGSIGDRFGGANVPRLPDSPLAARRLFEEPLPLTILLVAAAVIVWFILGRAGKQRPALIAAGALVLAAAIPIILAAAVQTTGERLRAQSKDLVDAVAAGDVSRVDGLLRSDVTVRPWSSLTHDGVLALVGADMRSQYAVKEQEVLESRAAIDGPNAARTQLHVRVVPESAAAGGPVASWWILFWAKSSADNQWRVVAIECQQIDVIGNPAEVHLRDGG